MATNNIFKFIYAGLIGAAICFGLPACTDDHFDIDTSGDVGGNATKTLWEQISSRSEVSNFATALAKTPLFKDEAHQVKKDDGTPYTFKDVLSGTQTLTVFAPTNNAFDETQLNALLTLLESDPYSAFLQMVGNHIIRYRHVASGTGQEETVTINGKRAIFDREAKTIKGISLLTANINATNGTLHTIGQVLPFNFNLYELIKTDSRFTMMRAWLTEHDTIYFDESRSASGGSDADGNPIYVDSIYSSVNPLFWGDYEETNAKWVLAHKGFNANIQNEDSVWVVALPTDAAWNEAFDRLAPYYNYAPYYVDKSDEDGFTSSSDVPKYITAKSASESDKADSLSILSRRMDLGSTSIFNLRLQPRDFHGFWTEETFLNATDMPKMFNTRRDTFRVNEELQGDVRQQLFQNVAPEKISNGLVYPVNYWAFMDGDDALDVNVKINNRTIFQASNMGTTTAATYSFNNAISKLVNDSLLGRVSDNSFLYVSNGIQKPTITFKLIDTEENHEVLSGVDYDIMAVMVPDFYRWSQDSIMGEKYGDDPIKKNHLEAQVFYIDGKTPASNGKLSESKSSKMEFEYNGTKVDTVYIGTIRFPYTYKNLKKAYPTITITSKASSTKLRQGYQHPFSLDRIILEARKN